MKTKIFDFLWKAGLFTFLIVVGIYMNKVNTNAESIIKQSDKIDKVEIKADDGLKLGSKAMRETISTNKEVKNMKTSYDEMKDSFKDFSDEMNTMSTTLAEKNINDENVKEDIREIKDMVKKLTDKVYNK